MADGLNMSRRIRRTAYTDRVEAAGVRGFSVVNHMLLPKAYARSVEDDYWHLREAVQVWDVSCQRQVEIAGPDAARLVQWMTPRDISRAEVGQCLYVPLVDRDAGLLNDPVLLKLAPDRFRLSIADSDVLLYALGLALGAGLDVTVREADVWPLAVQGPRAEDVMASLFGDAVRAIRFFRFAYLEVLGTRQLVARSGYSRQGGFEIYLEGRELGPALWDAVMEAGRRHDIAPGCPNLIERIEGGLLSYGNEMTRENTPFEIGLGKYCATDGSVDCVGAAAIARIAAEGHAREIRGVRFGGGPCPTCAAPWPVMAGARRVGAVTSAIWSPRLGCNVGLGMVDRGFWDAGRPVTVLAPGAGPRDGEVASLPLRQ